MPSLCHLYYVEPLAWVKHVSHSEPCRIKLRRNILTFLALFETVTMVDEENVTIIRVFPHSAEILPYLYTWGTNNPSIGKWHTQKQFLSNVSLLSSLSSKEPVV